jgi:hypothetical protein
MTAGATTTMDFIHRAGAKAQGMTDRNSSSVVVMTSEVRLIVIYLELE